MIRGTRRAVLLAFRLFCNAARRGGGSAYGYDVQDHLTSVTDAEGTPRPTPTATET